ncbi:hypothetical protein T03_9527 [Trichinella britovi]|uniref:Uncharacterized protein n=1 Tax=Trichinella britovi TaxID=45882 RepID=A0A0V0YT50_TRIBR|nr:hypothetical protein T03_9527 [Trichinella britovi]
MKHLMRRKAHQMNTVSIPWIQWRSENWRASSALQT